MSQPRRAIRIVLASLAGAGMVTSWVFFFAKLHHQDSKIDGMVCLYLLIFAGVLALAALFMPSRSGVSAAAPQSPLIAEPVTPVAPPPTPPAARRRTDGSKPSPGRHRPVEPLDGTDDAPTVPVVIRATVPSPRQRPVPQIYTCEAEAARPALTVEMAPVVDLGDRAAGIFDAGIKVGFDRGFSAAAGFVPPEAPDEVIADARPN